MLTGEKASDSSKALELLGRYGGPTAQRALTAAAAVQLLQPARNWVQARRASREYTITVGGTDDIYPDLHAWVLERMPARERRALLADTYRRAEYAEVKADGLSDHDHGPVVKLRYDGSRVQTVRIDGHSARVSVARESLPGGTANVTDNWRRYLEQVTFACRTTEGRDAVVRMIEGLAKAKYGEEERSPLLLPSRWGGDWNRRQDLKPRTLESVVLKAGQLERIVEDLAAFMASEQEYERLSQPWHRGYLFHGTPGTGKTSCARAIAHHFGMPVFYLPLADLDRDANLMNLVQAVRPRSMLLLEDADVYQATTERQDEHDRVSLAAMLNALDGVWTPHGLITVITTNKVGSLDAALLRPGRMDISEEFGPLGQEQIKRLCQYAGSPHYSTKGQPEFDPMKFVDRSPAELMEAIRAHRAAERLEVAG